MTRDSASVWSTANGGSARDFAGPLLDGSLDLEATVARVAQLASGLCETAAVDLIEGQGLRRVALAGGAIAPGEEERPSLRVLLSARGRDVGSLALWSPRLSLDTVEAALALGRWASLAIDNARRHHAEQTSRRGAERAVERLAHLHSIIAALADAQSPAQIAGVLTEAMIRRGAGDGGLWLRGPDGGALREPPAGASDGMRAAVQAAASRAHPLWIESHADYLTYVGHPSPDGERAIACLPLAMKQRSFGQLVLSFAGARHFPDDEREFLIAVAGQAALALERARLYEEERGTRAGLERAQRNSAFLAEANLILSSSLDYEITLRSVVRLLVPELVDHCVVTVIEPDGALRQVAEASRNREEEAILHDLRPHDSIGFSLGREAIETGRIQTVDGISAACIDRQLADQPEQAAMLKALCLRAVAIVPIQARGRVIGLLACGSTRANVLGDAEDQHLLQELADRAGLAIDNARLYREAGDAVRAREDFLSVASHELRTPLSALSLGLEMTARIAAPSPPPIAEKLARRLKQSDRQVRRLTALIDQLLDVSRITGGRLVLDLQEVDFSSVLSEVLERFDDAFAAAGCQLRLRAATPVIGRWDRSRLDQVLSNLVANAIKYGRGAPIEIDLTCANGEARLDVRDHGIGIPVEHQARIFGRFERAVSPQNYGGFGLGLWIARQIIEAMGGEIAVHSDPGDGALFSLRLPTSTASFSLSG